jgi:hypothetical protein
MHSDQTDTAPASTWVPSERLHDDTNFRDAVCAWVRANGIDPADVPPNTRASIVDGQLTITIRVKSAKGHHVIDPGDEEQMLTTTVTVPVKVPPSHDVELWLAPRCSECGR